MPLPYPPLGALRIASPREILRIGVVAAAGFRYSPVFDWERPYHEKFPGDTLLSYRKEFASCLKSPEHIVLVALDKFDPEEGSKSKIIIPDNNGWQAPKAGDEVVVGVACWKLQPGSSRIGDFQNDTDAYPDLPDCPDRDKDLDHSKKFGDLAEAGEKKYFHGLPTLEMVVVHPAYWSKGHGHALVEWGLELAKVDQISQGVIAATMGKVLFTKLGFGNKEDLKLDGDEIVPAGVMVSAMIFPKEKDPSAEL